MSRMIDIKIYKNEQLVEHKTFAQEVIKIGKLRSSDIRLDDDAVARMHAVLEVSPGGLRLVDLGSASGTSLNGRRVERSSAIASGDAFAMGPYRLELTAAPAPAVATAPGTAATAPAFAGATAIAAAPAPAPAAATASPRATLPVDVSDVEQPEHHVAEVITSFGETVLDVQHVGQVRSRRRQAPALLALGGLMLLAGGAIVAHEVTQDWDGYQAAREEAAALGRAAPEAPGTGLGGIGIGLALLGLVPLGLGVVRREDVGLDRYTVGEGHDATFHVAGQDLPEGEAFPLVCQRDDGGYVLQFTDRMHGELTVGGQSVPLHDLAAAGRAGRDGAAYVLPLPQGASARIEHGAVRYHIASVAKGKAIASKSEADKPFWTYNAACFAVMGGLLGMMHLVPEEALSMNLDDLTADNRYVGYLHQPDEEPEPEEIVQPTPEEIEDDPGGEGQRHEGEEGKMGKNTAQQKSGLYAMKGPKNAVPHMARNFDPELQARNSGILGMMQQESGHFLASPYGDAFAQGNDDEDVWGGLTGTEVGEAFGMGGMGLVGTGRGGGGTGEGTIGLGNVGTIGKGGGGGERSGYGGGGGTGFKDRRGKGPQIRRGKAKVKGMIDKDIIRRIVRNHVNEVRHCYNQGLSKDPNLAGRVAVMFTIGPTGTVPTAAVAEDSLRDKNVGRCIAKAVKRWKFPKPASGGSAMVTYPFSFAPG